MEKRVEDQLIDVRGEGVPAGARDKRPCVFVRKETQSGINKKRPENMSRGLKFSATQR